MRIDAILERKGREVVTVSPHTAVREAVRLLAERRIGAVVVSGDGRHPLGLFSEHGLVAQLARLGGGVLDLAVGSVMDRLEYTCRKSDTIEVVQEQMTERRQRHVPVVEDGLLEGIVSIGDVVASRIDELDRERAELFAYVGAR